LVRFPWPAGEELDGGFILLIRFGLVDEACTFPNGFYRVSGSITCRHKNIGGKTNNSNAYRQ
jgi:hypothetical protein